MRDSRNHSWSHSVNHSRVAHWGNGREWKGMEGKKRVETSIHSSSSVTRAARLGWMEVQQ